MVEHKAELGTLIIGYDPDELLRVFGNELEYLDPNNPLIADVSAFINSVGTNADDDLEHRDYLLDDLFEALDSLAPVLCYFGALENTFDDFGFWPSIDTIDEEVKMARKFGNPTDENDLYLEDYNVWLVINGDDVAVFENDNGQHGAEIWSV